MKRMVEKHDGVSPITIRFPESKEEAQFQRLWYYLVPTSGRAKSAQGEIIRIAGKICRTGYWDEDYKAMLRTFPQYLQLGNALDDDVIKKISRDIEYTIQMSDFGYVSGIANDLWRLALAWVKQNPNVIAPLKAVYKH